MFKNLNEGGMREIWNGIEGREKLQLHIIIYWGINLARKNWGGREGGRGWIEDAVRRKGRGRGEWRMDSGGWMVEVSKRSLLPRLVGWLVDWLIG